LTPDALTGFSGQIDDPYNFGQSTIDHETKGGRIGLITKAGTMFIIGYWGVELIQNFNYETLILRAVQIALSLAMGVIRYYRTYMYVTEEHRGKIIKKIDCLQMFEATMKREVDKHEQSKNEDAGRSFDELCDSVSDVRTYNPEGEGTLHPAD
jgi:hypothetical protein